MTTQTPWTGLEHITRIAATNHPVRGVVLGAIAHDYLVYTNQQLAAGGPDWSGWSGPTPIEEPWVFKRGAPPPGEPWPQNGSADLSVAFDLVGAQHALGMSQLWGLGMNGKLMGQVVEGGAWNEADSPSLRGLACVQWNVTGDPTKPIFSKPQRVLSSFQMWGVTRDCRLIHAFQVAQPSNGASPAQWDLTTWNDAPPAMAVAATMKNDNKGQVWLLDPQHRLWSCWWDGDAQAWSAWSGPARDDAPGWNNAPKLKAVAVSQHRGAIASRNRAAEGGEPPDHILLGINEADQLVATMLRGSNAHWEPWSAPNWNGCPQTVKDVAAVQQSDGCLQVWVVSASGRLMTIGQTKRGGDWGAWQVWTGRAN